ncbi:hypothetical protein HMPREF3222_02580 [Clostridium perfringens]|uniref:Uncharacterized protein n=1 Tax=Clostridium perfringens TaxID=1502 RepID=A0A133MV08_CLOPF|nr:hypothetical protein HMPREF3222_02580 [Clostridium perfringens]
MLDELLNLNMVVSLFLVIVYMKNFSLFLKHITLTHRTISE